jgi:hypothetical protein
LTNVKFEFTAGLPAIQLQGRTKVWCAIGRIRAVHNAGKFDQEMKDKLWGECAMTVTDVENLLVAKKQTKPAHEKFFEEELSKAECMRQFGEMGVIKTSNKIKGKLKDRGLSCVCLGQARDHAGDTCRFLNLVTKMALVSKDVTWLDQVCGEFTGNHDTPTRVIVSLANLNTKEKGQRARKS